MYICDNIVFSLYHATVCPWTLAALNKRAILGMQLLCTVNERFIPYTQQKLRHYSFALRPERLVFCLFVIRLRPSLQHALHKIPVRNMH